MNNEVGDFPIFMLGLCIGALVFGIITAIVYSSQISLDKETINDICKNITGNNGTTFNNVGDGKLHCQLPSFDSTQNIIIDLNNNKGGN